VGVKQKTNQAKLGCGFPACRRQECLPRVTFWGCTHAEGMACILSKVHCNFVVETKKETQLEGCACGFPAESMAGRHEVNPISQIAIFKENFS